MIQANELRLDNLVYDRNGEIHAIRDNDFHRFRCQTMDGNPSGFKPIPITEEILLKAGFVKMNEPNYFRFFKDVENSLSNFELQYWLYSHILTIIIKEAELDVNLKHLHQLQNLYFALTGKELEIKLTDVQTTK